VITAQQRPRQAALPPSLLGLAAAGAAATALALGGAALPAPVGLDLPPAARVLVVASAATLALTVALLPHRLGRRELVAVGLAALGAQAAFAALSDPAAVAAVVVLVGLGHAARPARTPLARRARGPVFAALLLGVGWSLVHAPGPGWLGRVGGLALALSLAAAAGLVPYLAVVERDEPASSSALVWTAFLAPALALALPPRVLPALSGQEGTVFGATLVALGLVNLGWGTIGAARTGSDVDAWRCSFLADWGLALVGIGLLVHDGFGAAYLAMLSIVLVRLPLYVWARPALRSGERARLGPVNVLLAAILAGTAPFAGFPVRLLVLHAAVQVFWPLALVLLLAMLAWLLHAVRLARTLVVPPGRGAAGLWLTVAASLVLGLAPGVVLAAGGT
jgi:hypothetical protein